MPSVTVFGIHLPALVALELWIRHLPGHMRPVSDAHEGLKAAITRVLSATWQRCRVHFMRNVLAHAGKQGRRVVSAFIATAFAQDDAAAGGRWQISSVRVCRAGGNDG